MNNGPLLVLASNSPRRKQLLSLSGWLFKVQPAEVDESLQPNEAAGDYVLRLARTKVLISANHLKGDWTVIAADTAVVDGRNILGKPKSTKEATRMLEQLRGHTHQVYTGIAALPNGGDEPITDVCITHVPMRNYSDEEVQNYVASGEPLDKAGAYAIQDPRFKPVGSISGCYSSVMGLPLCHLVHLLRRLDIEPKTDVPGNCQTTHGYQCSIYQAALRGEPVG